MLPAICGGRFLFVCIGLRLPLLRTWQMPFRFFYAYWLDVGHRQKFVEMEKTLKDQSPNCMSGTQKLFDLKELLESLNITPGQTENMKGLIYLEGLTEDQVRQKLSGSKIIGTNEFGVNSCLYYIFFEDVKGKYLCLFNGDKECFRALYFNGMLLH